MSNLIVRIKKVALKITRISVSAVIAKVESVLVKMKNNPNFINPNPPLATIDKENGELISALAKAKDGSKADKALVWVKLRKIRLSMNTLKSYVESTANNNAVTASEVIVSSGMDEKTFTPRKKRIFEVKNTNTSGTVKIWCPRTKKDFVFGFEYSLTPDIESSFVPVGFSPSASRTISKLISCKRYYFRWATITSAGTSDWSDVISIIVM